MEAGTERINDLYVMGRIDKFKYTEKMDRHMEMIRAKRNEVTQLEETAGVGRLRDDERLERLQEFKRVWNDLDIEGKEKNRVAKQIIEKIVYTRPTKAEIQIEVVFL